MKMTDQQVKETVAGIDFRRESDRERLLNQALAGDQGARLVVFGAMKRQRAAARTRIEFEARDYVNAHGRAPRGFGSWAFHTKRNPDACDPSMIWVHQSSYADAKRRAAAIARERFTSEPYVILWVQS